MWGKNANFIGTEAFGRGEMKPRAIEAPGAHYEYNDVRINRFSLSLLRLFKKPIPDVFRDEVMNPIGASTTWKWVPYTNAYVDIDGKRMASVTGGTRWGGGMWISTYDMARFGLLWQREGKWGDRQIVSPAYVKMATTPSAHGPDYGFLWWLNTTGKQWAGSPTKLVRGAWPGRQRHPHRSGPRSGRRVALERTIGGGIQEGRRGDHDRVGTRAVIRRRSDHEHERDEVFSWRPATQTVAAHRRAAPTTGGESQGLGRRGSGGKYRAPSEGSIDLRSRLLVSPSPSWQPLSASSRRAPARIPAIEWLPSWHAYS